MLMLRDLQVVQGLSTSSVLQRQLLKMPIADVPVCIE